MFCGLAKGEVGKSDPESVLLPLTGTSISCAPWFVCRTVDEGAGDVDAPYSLEAAG